MSDARATSGTKPGNDAPPTSGPTSDARPATGAQSATGAELGRRLREGDLRAAPATLNLLESTTEADRLEAASLLGEVSAAAIGHEPQGRIVGVTGPPGAGKSTLLCALLRHWRRQDRSVAMLAVDPSSRASGGSLLGDRARIDFDPSDRKTFIRSTAAGERLGGLAWGTRAAARALAAAFDLVVIETVGVGQAETEIADAADVVAVVVQPGGGDVLQFLKSGIMEIPDVLVVTKADLGQTAIASRRDLNAALRSLGRRDTPVIAVSSLPPPTGIEQLAQAIDDRLQAVDLPSRRAAKRRSAALADFVAEHGLTALRAIGGRRAAERLLADVDPALDEAQMQAQLVAELQRQTTG